MRPAFFIALNSQLFFNHSLDNENSTQYSKPMMGLKGMKQRTPIKEKVLRQ
jgi:hypothetical protein